MKSWSAWSRALAIAVVIGYGVFTWWLIREAGKSEVYWSRLVFLFQGVEALVFAAAGLVFGTSINRNQLSDAREAQKQALRRADEAVSEADVGRVIVAALHAYSRERALTEVPPPPLDSDRIGSGLGGWGPDPSSSDADFVSYMLRLTEELKRDKSVSE
jgi:hypothetical protein